MPDLPTPELPEFRAARLVRPGVIECEIRLGEDWLPFGAVEGEAGLAGAVYAAAAPGAEDRTDPGAELAAARAGMPPISRRQLLIGLAAQGWITAEEAVAAAAGGVMPAAVEAAVAALTPAEQTAARITWAAMSGAYRLDPLVELLAAAQGVTAEEVDAFFTACAQI